MAFGITPSNFDVSKCVFGAMVSKPGKMGGTYKYFPVQYVYGNGKLGGIHVAPSPRDTPLISSAPKEMNNKDAIVFIFDDYDKCNGAVVAIQLLIVYQCRKQMLSSEGDINARKCAKRMYPKFFVINIDKLARIDISTIDPEYNDSEGSRKQFFKLDDNKKLYSNMQISKIIDPMYEYLDEHGATVENALQALKTYAPDGVTMIANCGDFSFVDKKTGEMKTVSFEATGRGGAYPKHMLTGHRLISWPKIKYDRITHDSQSNLYRPAVSCHKMVIKSREKATSGEDEYFDHIDPEETEALLRAKNGNDDLPEPKQEESFDSSNESSFMEDEDADPKF